MAAKKSGKPGRKKVLTPSAGIYFVVFDEGKWQVRACRDESGALGHSEAWPEQIAPTLSTWARLLADEREELRQAYSGFPRGRVVRSERRFVVYHGNDWQKLVTQAEILEPFGLRVGNGVSLAFDEHERCMKADRETVRQILRIKTNWPTA